MTFGLRLFSVCAVAGLYGAASPVCGQTVDALRPTITSEADMTAQPVVTAPPTLTIVPEEQPAPARKPKSISDPYAALGIDMGGMNVFPSLEVGAVATSNVNKATSGEKSDLGLYLKPSLSFESDWLRHSWTGKASGDFIAYLNNDDLNAKNADIGSTFRLDIRHTTRAEFAAGYNLSQAGQENSEVPNTAIGNRTDHAFTASSAIIQDFGGFEGRAKLALERNIYGDVKLSGGGREDNSDRNTYTPSASLRLSYTEPPALKPFVELAYAPRIHDQSRDRNGLRRDSQGYTASAGLTLEHGPIWSGEAAIVYSVRDYADAALETNDIFGINGNLTWQPTDLTSVVLALSSTLDETSSATSSGTKTYSGHVDVTHALRDNLDLVAGLGLALEKVPGGTDKTVSSKLGLEWQINPELAWTASYDGTWFNGAASGDDYNEQRVMMGVVIRR